MKTASAEDLAGMRRPHGLQDYANSFGWPAVAGKLLATIDAKDAEIERLKVRAPLQVSDDATLRIRAEAIVASPYWGGCEKNVAEHILTGKYDSLHASVHKAALATPRGET